MRADARLRGAVYWGLDSLRGGPVKHHLEELEGAFQDLEATLALSRERSRALIDHACRTTRYYGQFQGAQALSEFPVLQKGTIRERYDEFLSSACDRASLIPVATSGSYGSPLTFLLSPEKKARRTAEVIYFGGWAGYAVGVRYAHFTVTRRSRLTTLLQNQIRFDRTFLDERRLEAQRQALQRRRLPLICSVPSLLGPMAEYCRAKGDGPTSFGVQAIICFAEPLPESVRAALNQVFGCPVLSRYSTLELGVLAHECRRQSHHHLNIASYVVELLSKDSDRPVSPGELGRVVVTDLFSVAMPLIRYDTGDLAVLGDACPCGRPGPTLRRVEGRLVEEVAGTNGQRIPGLKFDVLMADLDGIIQYQFAQTDERRYELRLHTLPSFHQEELARQRLLSVLGADADLQFRYVDQIPPLPSGKRPYIVNEWRQRSPMLCGVSTAPLNRRED
jgi:phenylacetate-CoA ligase